MSISPIQPLQYYQTANPLQVSRMPMPPDSPSGAVPPESKAPQVANVPPRPMRPLTQDEIALVNFRLTQSRPIKKKGLDIPMANLIASPQKQSVMGALHGGLVAFVLGSLLMDTVYKNSSPAGRMLAVALGTILTAGLASLQRSKKTQAQNEFAVSMMQHGVTRYDSMPRGIAVNRMVWKQLNGVG